MPEIIALKRDTTPRRIITNLVTHVKPGSSIRMPVQAWKRLDAAGKRMGGLSRGETVEVMLDLVEKQP